MIYEYLVKGLSLGVLGYLGWNADVKATALVYGLVVVGLVVALGLAWQRAKAAGAAPKSLSFSFVVYLLLEYPGLIYAGVLAGLLLGAGLVTFVLSQWTMMDLGIALGLGVGLGVILVGLRLIAQKNIRRAVVLALGAGAVALVIFYLFRGDLPASFHLNTFGLHLLLAVPVFYLLTISGRTEETEIEIGLVCVLLGIALWVLLGPAFQLVAMLIPITIYVGYTQYLLKDMQAFKALLRGMGHARLGATAEALTSYRRALHFSPNHKGAKQELWKVHRQIDLRQIHQDDRLIKLIDFELCLQRARDLLFADMVTPELINEAKQLLDLVNDQRPQLRPAVMYYRAVAYTHGQELDKAEQTLRQILDESQFSPDEKSSRQTIMVPAWQLALMQHGELRKRVGEPLLQLGQRMAAIAAVEYAASKAPLTPEEQELKARLYADVTLAEYNREAGSDLQQQAIQFDHKFVYERGLDLLDSKATYERGVELLAIAVRGQPKHAPAVWKLAADAAAHHGDTKLAKQAQNEVKAWTKLLGLKETSSESQAAYFATVKQLGEAAYHEAMAGRQAPEAALENLLLASEAPQSGVDTLRMLADLYELQGNVVQTMHYNEQCLMYDGKNKHYLDRKDRLYVSLTEEDLVTHKEKLSKLIDLNYLVKKPKEILENKNSDHEQLQWAKHLAKLMTVAAPERVAGWAMLGRIFLRLGQAENGVKALEYAHHLGKENKPSGEDLDQWYLDCRILGDHYLQQQRYEEAQECLKEFSQSTKSGADTHYKLGQAAEGLGDVAKAKKHYQSANMFDHPQKYEVSQALERLNT
ncbi:MAG TPA: tetratricopeptide repeat protein [Gemmatales bacterium]|nr:tetratricopeptide repeat protein [Gemmatales bacterium]